MAEIINILGRLANKSDNMGLVMYTTGYEPFISLFHMLGLDKTHPEFQGIGASPRFPPSYSGTWD